MRVLAICRISATSPLVRQAADQTLRVALLYSCATSNQIYKQLASESDVILYRGAPYHQSQYAYGLNIHVGPVAGWLPPRAPGSTVGSPLSGKIKAMLYAWMTKS